MKSAGIIVLIIFLSVFSARLVTAADAVTLEYFFINPSKFGDCPSCYDYSTDQIITDIQAKYYGQVSVERIDVTNALGSQRFYNYNLTGVPAVVLNKEYKVSKEGITFQNLDSIISQYLGGSTVNPPSNTDGSVNMTLPLVVASAFIDGINPCAFALLVFFLSYLFSIQKSRGRILAMGATYIIGLFITYFLIGFGLLQSVSFFGIAHSFGLIGVVLAFVIGFLTITEYLAPGRFTIKFPSRAVPTFKSTVQKATMPAALLLGVFVGLCEFPCTGAIYGVVLARVASEATFSSGVIYLILYNLIFVLPLLVILLLASNIKRLTKFDTWRLEKRRHLKLVAGLFMIGLGVLVLYTLIF